VIPPEFHQLSGFLTSCGFLSGVSKAGTGFGDSVVEYKSPSFRLRLVSDRGQSFAEISPSSGMEWFDIPLLAFFIRGSGPDVMTPSEQTDFIAEQFLAIESLMASTAGIKSLNEARKSRAKRRMPGLFR